MKIPVAILGATGYTGAELIRLIDGHPHFTIAHLAAHSQAGKAAGAVLPGCGGRTADMTLAAADAPLPEAVQLVFTALPHAAAATSVANALSQGKKVVDLSADFRHQSAAVYQQAYAVEHPCPELFQQAVYGLCEHARDRVAATSLVANPGCYPTSTLLPLIPLLKAGLLDTDGIIVDSKSGASGAGRSAKTDLLYCEINESVKAYGMPRHRHAWEMEEWAEGFTGSPVRIRFVPHILPMTRGMLTTLHLSGKQVDRWHAILQEAYSDEPFVRVLAAGELPSTGGVCGSNRCDIGISVVGEHEVVIVSCIDNLLKGAAGQAVQNANLMFSLDEGAGLSVHATWP
ncbi:N-acetyl-gamma-glutamyl-phosphate reductase [Mariprofundus ferrooxydans]|uniref:N-acetyl-gamma-glutamyl-phosphate reductase n=1 Tax=Mariprofundus ferrooxydans PV-1 TaxID=314345 RepID=Q0EZ18_9PROT|nr:N-acetyl-gamma-glutamyl-phosphate reductase [Mariprofundus ferrooxydans]EAU54606.1 N-acetyl-gamma-glutamyl-phosphate reductase [Mariprofundus ferrooxydans PV-1]KON48787.1 N-acetyl-gamma-glutamyl-phosphate reductase [Mariprofundus ferrooxydans]